MTSAVLDEQSPEQAMRSAADRWNQITEDLGVESQVEAIASSRSGWVDVVDDPPGA